jgi:hypothetical protein
LTGLRHQKPNQPGGQDCSDLVEPLGCGHPVGVERVWTSEHGATLMSLRREEQPKHVLSETKRA